MRRPLLSISSLLVVLSLLGCSAAFDGSIYRGNGYAFRVGPMPPSWHAIRVSQGGGIAFRDEMNSATIAANGRCHLDGEDVPLAALTRHLFIQFTEREVERQEVVPFDGREALHTRISAKLDGVALQFDVWVLKKDGCVYDLYYMAPPDRFQRGAPDFARFVGGFGTVMADGT